MHTHKSQLEPYARLLEDFLQARISALDFETKYLKIFTEDPTMWTKPEYKILERLFESVDAFCADESLIEPEKGDLTEDQLRLETGRALDALKQRVTRGLYTAANNIDSGLYAQY
jgi:hypothetical protein